MLLSCETLERTKPSISLSKQIESVAALSLSLLPLANNLLSSLNKGLKLAAFHCTLLVLTGKNKSQQQLNTEPLKQVKLSGCHFHTFYKDNYGIRINVYSELKVYHYKSIPQYKQNATYKVISSQTE